VQWNNPGHFLEVLAGVFLTACIVAFVGSSMAGHLCDISEYR